jgi:hypothetical protein
MFAIRQPAFSTSIDPRGGTMNLLPGETCIAGIPTDVIFIVVFFFLLQLDDERK